MVDTLAFSPDGTFTQTLTSGTVILRRHGGKWNTGMEFPLIPYWNLSGIKNYSRDDVDTFLTCSPSDEIEFLDEYEKPDLVFEKTKR